MQFGDTRCRAWAGTGCRRRSGSTRPGSWTRRSPAGGGGRPGAARRELDHARRWPRAAAPHLVGADQAAWLDRLDAELGNLRAAIAFCLTQADPAPGLPAGRLAAGVLAGPRARRRRSRRAAGAAGRAARPQEATLPRARALAAAARLLQQTGGYAIAADYCQEALVIARAAGDDYLVAGCCEYALPSCCARGNLAPRCWSSNWAWAWPTTSGNPT